MTSRFEYRDLNQSANEIRILRFPGPPARDRELIRCTLHHVSLDQLLPIYQSFRSEFRSQTPKELSQYWLESYFCETEWPCHGAATLFISASRYRAESERLYSSSCGAIDEGGNVLVPSRFFWGDYETMSYCWESNVRDKTILLDGLPVEVPTNFEAMLRHVQDLPEARSGMGFWADGICINQANLLEKESQIGLMKRIYAQALSTVIWLGPGHEGSDIAVDVMNENFRDCRPISESNWYSDPRSKNGVRGEEWQSLLDLWSRNYFKRMWIIQELALNKSLSVFICGTQQFSRLVLQDACHWVREHAGDVAQAIMGSAACNANQINPDHVWSVAADVLNLVTLSATEDDIDQMYDLAHRSQVKEPHDKVYGLLGLLPVPLATKIKPDYSKPFSAVFTEFATLLLQGCWRLDEVLSWSTLGGQNSSPFWVPNWMEPHQRNHIQWFRKFNAGGDNKPGRVLLNDGMTLSCKGSLLDRVEQASLPCSQTLPYQRSCPWQASLCKIDTPGKALKDAVERTLFHRHPRVRDGASILGLRWTDWKSMGGSSTNIHMLDKIHGSSHHWQSFDRFRHTNANFLISGWRLKDFFPRTTNTDLTDPFEPSTPCSHFEPDDRHDGSSRRLNMDARPIELEDTDSLSNDDDDETDRELPLLKVHTPEHIKYATKHEDHLWKLRITAVALRNRRLFTTHTGLLGLAPDETQVGDTIAILVGCNYPVVLRPYHHGFKYVGECYIDGLMDGEAFEATNRSAHKIEDILIL